MPRRLLTLAAFLLTATMAGADTAPGALPLARSIVSETLQGLPFLKDETEAVRDAIVSDLAVIQIRLGDLKDASEALIQDPLYKDRVLSRLAVAYAEQNDLDTADSTLFKMKSQLYSVDALTGMGKAAGKGPRAHGYFRDALARCAFIESLEDRLARLKALAIAEAETVTFMVEAIETLKVIPSEKIQSELMAELVEIADPSYLLILKFIASQFDIPDLRERSLGDVAVAFAKKGDSEPYDAVMEDIKDAYGRAKTLAELAQWEFQKSSDAEEAVRRLQQARRYARAIKDDVLRSETLTKIAQLYVYLWSPKEAKATFQLARQAALQIGDVVIRAQTLTQLGSLLASHAETKESVEVFQGARLAVFSSEAPVYQKAKLLGVLGEAMAVAGCEGTKELLSETAALSKELDDPAQKNEIHTYIAIAFWQMNFPEEGERFIKSAISLAREIDDDTASSDALIRIALAYTRFGRIQDVLPLTAWVRVDSRKGELLFQACKLHAKNGKAEEALQTARSANKKSIGLRGLLGTATGLFDKEDEDKATSGYFVRF